MTQTEPRFSSFGEYLAYDDGTEKLYEWFNGALIEVPPKSVENTPLLVVEIVSSGDLQRDRDYIAKRIQYQARIFQSIGLLIRNGKRYSFSNW